MTIKTYKNKLLEAWMKLILTRDAIIIQEQLVKISNLRVSITENENLNNLV